MVDVDCVGEGRCRCGGLALLWGDMMDIRTKSFSNNHIDVWVNHMEHERWRFTCVYGYPKDDQKHKTGRL